jgi:alpha-tubulin suppressor-like RCC1 family protein
LQQVKGVNGVGTISGIIEIVCGPKSSFYSLFLASNGSVYACGLNSAGALGVNNNTNYQSLQQVKGVKGVNGVGTIAGITQCGRMYNFTMFLYQ